VSIRYRNPETVKLDISQGDWLLVKKHLTAGEYRSLQSLMLNPDRSKVDPINVTVSGIATYLLDWSIDGLDGKRVVITDKTDREKMVILDNLPLDVFNEISAAISAHVDAVDAEQAQEKNVLTTVGA